MTTCFFDFYIDRGGTFTDVFYRANDGKKTKEGVLKLLSEDPANYEDAPAEAIKRITKDYQDYKIRTIRMGTTVSTNALLERKGARTAFLTSKGFKDLLEIAYQNRPKIFDLDIKKAKQLYEIVVELDERYFLTNEVQNKLNLESIKVELEILKKQGIESLAIAFMHSYKDPSHELKVKELALDLGFQEISLSCELVPMIKYVTRASTTVIDAYLSPIIKRYINKFKSCFSDGLENTELLFMKSDGSLTTPDKFRGFNSILSGPAGGVTALRSMYQNKPLIGFDMGGTSTDVSRYDGDQNLNFDSEIEGLLLQSPQLDINTIAAGGGSRLFVENGLFRVGPESAGSNPGPISYKKAGYLTITDANLVLGKLNPDFFPKVFGANADEILDYKAAYNAFEKLKKDYKLEISVEEIAQGFIQVANETMARPIREVSSVKGYDVRNHDLVCFGGAAAQHAVSVARLLGIKKIIIHRHSGILSAFGISLAQKASQKQMAFGKSLSKKEEIDLIFSDLCESFESNDKSYFEKSLNLRYQGTDTKFLIKEPLDDDYAREFKDQYLREFGFNLDREIICEDILLKMIMKEKNPPSIKVIKSLVKELSSVGNTKIYFDSKWYDVPIYNFDDLSLDTKIFGPALIMQDTATIVVEPDSSASLDSDMNLNILVLEKSKKNELENNPINLAIFSNRFMSIAEQMGKTLERTSISTNIKERRDFSCAIFNKEADLIANAPHQPVHLGSMGYAVKKQIENGNFTPGDTILSNHPVMGGSHLPDLTVITPVFNNHELIFFVANRAHHADIGGISPGSMPSFSKYLSEEGVAIKSFKLLEKGIFQEDKLREIFKESRSLEDNVSDLRAQVASNNQGISLIKDLIEEYSKDTVLKFMDFILVNSQKLVEDYIVETINSQLSAFDFLDDGSKINLKITRDKNKAIFDFTGTALEQDTNLNTPIAVLSSAILYCLRAIINKDIPLNQGFLKPIEIIVPENSILNPSEDKAVVAGNVQTSQRIVDVIFKAFGVCAASQGCMNNVIFGRDRHCKDPKYSEGDAAIQSFGYYETIGGGAGAGMINGIGFHGASGVHTHMTNTRITDPEILESRYPVILKEFSIRKNSGGKGKFNGGDGLVRHFKFLGDLDLSLLTERRIYAPYGLNGADDGLQGENWLLHADGNEEKLASKVSLKLRSGDELRVLTPGGGGFGK
jgi:5-oxoprolinase (ATP-hydrolysing)